MFDSSQIDYDSLLRALLNESIAEIFTLARTKFESGEMKAGCFLHGLLTKEVVC
jgi:hypothetical protein